MKQSKTIIMMMVFAVMTGFCTAQPRISVIPQPVKPEMQTGEFVMTSETVIIAEGDTEAVGRQLASMLRPATGYPLNVRTRESSGSACIVLRLETATDKSPEEGYRLEATPNRVVISASAPSGLYYGCQTLRQLLPEDIFSTSAVRGVRWSVPCVTIEDYPRFGWRGLMLDTSRHFMPKEFVKKFIDLLAVHKMNTFHWHLNEDQGWRIEIKRYPKLTEIGAWRKQTVIGRNTDQYDGIRHGGFYTQDEIREIVAYARERFITIVPEIEMPGHSLAALSAYPELSCTGGPFEVQTRWGVYSDVYCAGNDAVFTFLENVLTETMALFPGEYIHIGGDECPKNRWKACPKCQARIKAEGLSDEHELQSYFIKRIEKFLNANGRRLIGWDEILEGGLAPQATVMSWRGEAGGIQAAQEGHDVVMAPNSYTYLDYYQAPAEREPLAIGGFVPIERVYGFNPTPAVLTEAEQKHILGVQGQIWTEYISTPEHAEYMAYPRACALSETAWTPAEQKDFADFYARLERHLERLTFLNVNYRRLDPPKVEIGGWSSGQTDETYKPMEWDVTKYVEGPGVYTFHFSYTHGAHRLDIRDAELLCGDEIIATDAHEGRTGSSNHLNSYTLIVPETNFNRNAGYRLRAAVRSDGGSDSNGRITISKDIKP